VPDPDRVAVTVEQLQAEGARQLGRQPRGSVIWLVGDLGAGKTTFVQAVTRAARSAPARSPTYALVHEYPSPSGPIVHVDCYRLARPDDAVDLDFPDLVARARLLLIEWPERAGSHVPQPDVTIHLSHHAEPELRWLEVTP
jgi:tRNA threonylcarbamoyladenosine biosynthesis protein TsaE